MKKKISSNQVVMTSLIVSVFDVILNMAAAILTGSTVLISQSLQGMSDVVTNGLLLTGVKRSTRAADARHQFGYGREIFFWVLMAGIVMFLGAGTLSLYFGFQQAVHPGKIDHVLLGLVILVLGVTSNGYAFNQSVRRLKQLNPKISWWTQLRNSSIVETKTTLLIDFLGTVSTILGLCALAIFVVTGNARFDGLGSIIIGLTMMIATVLLVTDVRDLIVGRSVGDGLAAKIRGVARSADGVISVLDLRTMYLGSGKLLVIIEVHIEDGLDTDTIEKIIDNVKLSVQKTVPEVHHIQVEVETPDDELL